MKGLGIHPGGRPYLVADIDFVTDEEITLLDRFYKVTKDFHYRELSALSRAYGVSYQTAVNWKYLRTTPRWGVMLAIIEWAKNGKPMRKVQPGTEPFGMF